MQKISLTAHVQGAKIKIILKSDVMPIKKINIFASLRS